MASYTHKTNSSGYACGACKQVFSSRSRLIEHLHESDHKGILEFNID